MSRALFAFLGTDASQFKSATLTSPDDAGVGRHVAECLASLKRTPHDIAAFNDHLLGIPDPENLAGFLEERAEVAPDRPDIATHADLIDFEEGRDVPIRHS
jgi:hypothetical protein